jgi:hypothetical protein
MVNNSTNITKTNDHLSPQIIEHKNKITTYGGGNPGPVLVIDTLDQMIANFQYYILLPFLFRLSENCIE